LIHQNKKIEKRMVIFKKPNIAEILNNYWELIVQARDSKLSEVRFSQEEVEILKYFAELGVIDLMWTKTTHNFSMALDAALDGQELLNLNQLSRDKVIEKIMESTSVWMTKSIKCNWN
jgi:glucose dehydrogenase